MIERLIKLADRLDRNGDKPNADLIDSILKLSSIEERLELSNWISTNISEEDIFEMEDESKMLDEVMENLYNSLDD